MPERKEKCTLLYQQLFQCYGNARLKRWIVGFVLPVLQLCCPPWHTLKLSRSEVDLALHVCVCVCAMSVTAWVSARKLCVCECVQASVCPLSVCCQLSDWKLLFQICNKRLFPKCSLSADTLLFLLNEAKPVAQRQSVNKRGNTKKDLSTHVSRTISRGVKKEWDPERLWWGGCKERKSATVSREGKRSHTRCHYFFPPGRLLWFGEEFWLRPVWSLLQCDPVQMASSPSPLCLQHTAETVTDAQHS